MTLTFTLQQELSPLVENSSFLKMLNNYMLACVIVASLCLCQILLQPYEQKGASALLQQISLKMNWAFRIRNLSFIEFFFNSVLYRLSILYLKCLGPEAFWILEYLYRHYKVSWNSSLNIKFMYVSCIPYTQSLVLILYHILNSFMHEIKFPGVEFSTCAIMLALKKC